MLRIGLVLVPGFQVMYLAALSAFEMTNIIAKEKLYDIQILSEEGGLLTSSIGMPIQTQPFGNRTFDTLGSDRSPARRRPQENTRFSGVLRIWVTKSTSKFVFPVSDLVQKDV